MSTKAYRQGDNVKWKWGGGYGHGSVKSVFTKKVTRKIDGEEITRNGSEESPAYYIERQDGNNVLKLHREIEKDS